jgi:hypothetical protein
VTSLGLFLRRLALLSLAAAVVVTIRTMLSFVGYRRIIKFIPRRTKGVAPTAMHRRVVSVVRLASRHVPQASCLTQALSVQLILALRGYASEIHIGVARRSDGRFDAHAWVISANEIIIGGTESEIADYQHLMTLPN